MHTENPNFVKIVECGARDGLQNEPGIVDVTTKVLLIDKLAKSGLKVIESGAMVSKKAVPQVMYSMASIEQLLTLYRWPLHQKS